MHNERIGSHDYNLEVGAKHRLRGVSRSFFQTPFRRHRIIDRKYLQLEIENNVPARDQEFWISPAK